MPRIVTLLVVLGISSSAVAQCPTVASVEPGRAPQNTILRLARITGTDLNSGGLLVKLQRAGQVDIVATDMVTPDAATLTCTFNLNGAEAGLWDVVIEKTDCPPVTLPGGFEVLQNFLLNPSFDQPDRVDDVDCIACQSGPNNECRWANFGPEWQKGNNPWHRDGDVFIPKAPVGCISGEYASIQGGAPMDGYYYQTIGGLTPGTTYTFLGQWAGGAVTGSITWSAEVREGTEASSGTLLNELSQEVSGARDYWTEFAMNVTPTTSTVTVVLRASSGSGSILAMHVDECAFIESICTELPTVTGMTPDFWAWSTPTPVTVTVSGTHLNAAPITAVVLTRAGQADLVATNIQVAPDGNSLTCDFSMSPLPVNGHWDLVVRLSGCPSAGLTNAFLIVLSQLINGNFNLPTSPAPGCNEDNREPSAWLWQERLAWGGGFARNTPRYKPTCDTAPFGSAISFPEPNLSPVFAEFLGWETIRINPGTTYTLRANFAGGGNIQAFLELLDGDENAPPIPGAQMRVADGEPTFDWRPAVVTGMPTNDRNLMTVRFRALGNAPDPHAIHVDEFVLGTCASPISVAAISHESVVNDGLITGFTITGSGFAGSPKVIVGKKTGERVPVSNVNVVSSSEITCDVEFNGASSGPYDVIVMQGNCTASLSAMLRVVATQFTNGSFDLPVARAGCGNRVSGLPKGWHTNLEVLRDGERAGGIPTCPRPNDDKVAIGEPPNATEHSHYGSILPFAAEPCQAWQTIQASPGRAVEFAGYFAGVGDNTLRLRILDGDELGPPLASTTVFSGPHNSDWTFASVRTTAPAGGVVTIMWELTDVVGGGPHAAHADGLTVGSGCFDPFADADGDGDVDSTDFGVWQACVEVNGAAPLTEECQCFDRNGDGGISIDNDFVEFVQCGSGPAMPANQACDD